MCRCAGVHLMCHDRREGGPGASCVTILIPANQISCSGCGSMGAELCKTALSCTIQTCEFYSICHTSIHIKKQNTDNLICLVYFVVLLI